jgi:hypothetical protein
MMEAGAIHTGLLLLQGHLLPVDLHAVPERHPQIGLLLGGHVFPSLLNVGERRVGDGMGLAGLLLQACCGSSAGAGSLTCRGRWEDGSRAPRGAGDGGAQHSGGRAEWRVSQGGERKGSWFPSRERRVPMGGVEGESDGGTQEEVTSEVKLGRSVFVRFLSY